MKRRDATLRLAALLSAAAHLALYLTLPPPISAAPGYNLDAPEQDSIQSGVGLIRGWVCDPPQKVAFQIDDNPVEQIGYGTSRPDVQSACPQNLNSGFGATINWNRFPAGSHRIRLYINDIQFVERTFAVAPKPTGQDYVDSLSKTAVITDFPNPGDRLTVQWNTPAQNFIITDITKAAGISAFSSLQEPEPASSQGTLRGDEVSVQAAGEGVSLDAPEQGSIQSGVGLIRGWICDTPQKVSFQIDDDTPEQIGYGTSRPDVLGSGCARNAFSGFGATINWNRFSAGPHRIRLYINDALFTDRMFTVAKKPTEQNYVEGLSKTATVMDFPNPGDNVVVQWNTPAQNFIITSVRNAQTSTVLGASPAYLNFGVVSASNKKSFTLANAGAASLSVDSVGLAPNSAPVFTIDPPLSFSLAANDSRAVVVAFNPPPRSSPTGPTKTLPAFTGKVQVKSASTVTEVELSANFRDTVPATPALVSPSDFIGFENVEVGEFDTEVLNVTNGSLYAPLHFSFSTSPPFFVCAPIPGSPGVCRTVPERSFDLPPGASESLLLVFRPTREGCFNRNLDVTIDSDEPDAAGVELEGCGEDPS